MPVTLLLRLIHGRMHANKQIRAGRRRKGCTFGGFLKCSSMVHSAVPPPACNSVVQAEARCHSELLSSGARWSPELVDLDHVQLLLSEPNEEMFDIATSRHVQPTPSKCLPDQVCSPGCVCCVGGRGGAPGIGRQALGPIGESGRLSPAVLILVAWPQ